MGYFMEAVESFVACYGETPLGNGKDILVGAVEGVLIHIVGRMIRAFTDLANKLHNKRKHVSTH